MIPIFSPKQSARLDSKAINDYGISGKVLMELAGYNSAGFIMKMSSKAHFLIFCGTGNNGGDGFVIAKHLRNFGRCPHVFIIGSESKLKADALYNFEIIKKLNIPFHFITGENIQILNQLIYETLKANSVIKELKNKKRTSRQFINQIDSAKNSLCYDGFDIIDSIFGTGFNGIPREPYLSVIKHINSLYCKTFAIDMPSGVDGNSGTAESAAVKADYTLYMAFPKKGYFSNKGIDNCGELVPIDIGLNEDVHITEKNQISLLQKRDIEEIINKRSNNSYKNVFGHLGIIAGSNKYKGAAVLTSNAAIKSGAGLVTLFSETDVVNTMPEIIFSKIQTDTEKFYSEEIKNRNAVVIGPGLSISKKIKELFEMILTDFKGIIVLDASIFQLFEEFSSLIKSNNNIIATPHPGEFSKISNLSVSEIMKEKFDITRNFISEYGINLILKGPYTLITLSSTEQIVLPFADSSLATAGSGDVLSGILGSFAAQGYSVEDVIKIGTWIHASSGIIAGKTLSPFSSTASSIIDSLPAAFKSVINTKE